MWAGALRVWSETRDNLMHVIRRALAILALAFALTTVTGAAYASPLPGPNPAPGIGDVLNGCKQAPTPQGPWLADSIDPGPATPGSDEYSLYGYAGYRIIPYDVGCDDMLRQFAVDQMPGPAGGIAQLFTSDGAATQAGDRFLTAATFIAAVVSFVARTVFGGGQAFGFLDPIMQSMRLVSGIQAITAFAIFTGAALGLWIMWRRLTFDRAAKIVVKSTFVLCVGIAAALWNGNIGPYLDQAVTATYRAAVGVSDSENVTDVGGIVGDVLVNHVIFPAWSSAMLGDGMEDYGRRLHAASTFTRAEWQRVQDNPGEMERLTTAKNEDWTAVAEEIKTQHPAAYSNMATAENRNWAFIPAMALVAVLGVAVVAGFLGGVAGAGLVLLRLLFGAMPLVALVSVLPWFRTVFDVVWSKIKTWVIATPAATVGFVAYLTVILRPIGLSDQPYLVKAGAYALAAAIAGALWHWRREVLARLKIEEDLDNAKSAVGGVADAATGAGKAAWERGQKLREWMATQEQVAADASASPAAAEPESPTRPASQRPVNADMRVLESAQVRRDAQDGSGTPPAAPSSPGSPVEGSVVSHRPQPSAAGPGTSADPRQEYLERREAEQRRRARRASTSATETVTSTVTASHTASKQVAVVPKAAAAARTAAAAPVKTAVAVASPTRAVASAAARPARSVIRKDK